MGIRVKGQATVCGEQGCHVNIRIKAKGDVHIHACSPSGGGRAHRDETRPPCRTEGACIPLGLGNKPKQSRRTKLTKLKTSTPVPSVLAASFFQTGRRFLTGVAAANDFESATFPAFAGMSPEVRDLLACAVNSYETTPPDLRDAGLEPSILDDPDQPVDSANLANLLVREIGQRAAEAAFGDVAALEERPGLNRFFEPEGEFFESQLQICRLNGLRTASHRPPIPLGDRQPGEIQQTCVPVLGPDGQISQNCTVQSGSCDGNILQDSVCARVPEVANGDAITLSGLNFMNIDIKVRLTAKVGSASAEVDSHVFGDLTTPQLDADGNLIRDCRVNDQLSFAIPDDLPPGVYEVQLAMPNTTGFPLAGPVVLSNVEYITIVPPATARFQIVAERMRARQETSPASFGSDEVALTFLSAALLPDGTTSSLQSLKKRFDDVDSGDNRTIETVIFAQPAPAFGVGLTIVGYEVDSERAFRLEMEKFEEVFTDYLKRAWDTFKAEISSAAGGLIAKLSLLKGAIVVAIAAVIAVAVIAIVARWAPADLIMEDVLGFSSIDLAELTNIGVPTGGITNHKSPRDLKVVVTPLGKSALTYREFREYRSDDEDSNYEVYLRYNRVA